MAIVIWIQELSNSQHPKEYLVDEYNVLPRILPLYDNDEYVYLNCIDPYEDTVFNYLQIPYFLAEWEKLSSTVEILEHRQFMAKVAEFARRAQRKFLYLRFVGD